MTLHRDGRLGNFLSSVVPGAIAGLVVALVTSRLASTQTPAASPTANEAREQSAPTSVLQADPRTVTIMAPPSIPSASPATAPASAGPLGPAAPYDPVTAREVSRAFHQRMHDARVDRHDREGVDPRWAASAKAAFSEGLAQAAQHGGGFEVENVDCRTTMCTARVRWPSYEAAERGYPRFLHQRMGLNCEREILLPDDDGSHGPVEATGVFDCEEARAAE